MLSLIDRVLIQRTEEAMRTFDFSEFKEKKSGGPRFAQFRCPVPGCKARTRKGNCCRRHWRHRHKYAGHSVRR